MGFECTIKPQNFIKIVGAIFWENQNFKLFLTGTTLNFRGRGKTKKMVPDIYKTTLDIEFQLDRLIGLVSTFGDGQTDGQTDTHTHTHTHTNTHTHTFFSKTHF